VQTCTCASNDCVNNLITSCSFSTTTQGTNIVPGRNYHIHVRAADAVGNETILDPASSYQIFKATDTESPLFTANFVSSYDAGNTRVVLEFDKATDTQATSDDANLLSYRIYRKEFPTAQGTPFTCLLTPW